MPFREDVVIGHVLDRKPGRNKVRSFWIVGPAFRVDRVEQSIPGNLRIKYEADESAFQTVVVRVRKGLRHVGVDLRPVTRADHIKKPARVIEEAAAIWKIAHIADACPSGRI